ncbi:MAG: YXWGXW repeat-containing protein [Acidobacteriota bacterium]|nr:YXWGXW repeat-containing protein [Acidobacteriota bacterium]MDQ5872241.1 YXWGXW repeat-containing protein [Acidobacteriota bacterium]
MSKVELKILAAAFLTAALAAPAAAQLPPPPPLPDEIRPRIVAVAPPALRVEAVVARPGPTHVWARGYWDWDGDSWAWVPGRWAVGPTRAASWMPARYERVSSGWEYVPAHWSSQRVVSVEKTGQGKALGHKKAKGKGHLKGKGKGHEKHD